MNIKDIEDRLMNNQLHVRFHNGVGFMQAYLTEDVRMHVWHPELTVPAESFGCRHDHRFDLESHILLGAVVDTQYEECDWNGPFKTYKVKPAHFNDPIVPTISDDDYGATSAFYIYSIRRYEQGENYKVKARVFHKSEAYGLTVTIMKKSNQVENWARIISPSWQKPEHGMAVKPPQPLLDQLFFSALRRLPAEANVIIHKLTK